MIREEVPGLTSAELQNRGSRIDFMFVYMIWIVFWFNTAYTNSRMHGHFLGQEKTSMLRLTQICSSPVFS